MWAKLLLVLLVFSFFAPVCFSLDAVPPPLTPKEKLSNELLTLETQWISLMQQLTTSKLTIDDLKNQKQDLEKSVEDLKSQQIADKKLLAALNQKLADIATQLIYYQDLYQRQSEQAKELVKRFDTYEKLLRDCEDREKWYMGGCIVLGTAMVVELLIIIFGK